MQPFDRVTQFGVETSSLGSVVAAGGSYRRFSEPGPPSSKTRCGFAWGLSRRAFDALGGLFDLAIAGGGDMVDAAALTRDRAAMAYMFSNLTEDFRASVERHFARGAGLKLGALKGAVRHIEHGRVEKRGYVRAQSFFEDTLAHFQPSADITRNADGLIVPMPDRPLPAWARDIPAWLASRSEDEN